MPSAFGLDAPLMSVPASSLSRMLNPSLDPPTSWNRITVVAVGTWVRVTSRSPSNEWAIDSETSRSATRPADFGTENDVFNVFTSRMVWGKPGNEDTPDPGRWALRMAEPYGAPSPGGKGRGRLSRPYSPRPGIRAGRRFDRWARRSDTRCRPQEERHGDDRAAE